MKNVLLALLVLGFGTMALPSGAYADRVHVFIGGGCCWGYPPGYGYYGYPSPYYVAPPPVVYVPPPPPTVVYQQPVYAAPPQPYPAGVPADQASPTFTDGEGRTCREYQTTAKVGGVPQQAYGTACLQPDGSWRIVR